MRQLFSDGHIHIVECGTWVGNKIATPTWKPIGYVVKGVNSPVGSSWKYRTMEGALAAYQRIYSPNRAE